jgi:hypothetical protein
MNKPYIKTREVEVLDAYLESFAKCYPEKNVMIIPAKRGAKSKTYRIVIDGDKGNLELSLSDLEEATVAFNR